MNLDSLKKSQANVIRLLENSYKKNRLVHSYIFEGPRGTKKTDAALFLASLLLCSSEYKPCLECHDCRRALNFNHPNLVMIEPDNEAIKKEQIEDLIHNYSLTSLEDNNRVYIIKNAELLTASAANSLLKFLEEPSDNIYGILITENIQIMLNTIKSRCQIISFLQKDKEEMVNRLTSLGIDEEISRVLSAITNDEDEIISMINEGLIIDIIDLVKEIGFNIMTNEKNPLVVLFEKGQFLFALNKRYNHIFIDILVIFLTDQLFYSLKQLDQIVFSKTISDLGLYIEKDISRISQDIEKLLDFKQRLNYNVNLELMYSEMMLMFTR